MLLDWPLQKGTWLHVTKALPTYTPESPADATRNLSQQNLNALAKVLPGLLGGSAALCEAGVIYVMTHDSIGLGEDGPTHQPIKHLASFRAMPNILMLRPADGNETVGAYKVAVRKFGFGLERIRRRDQTHRTFLIIFDLFCFNKSKSRIIYCCL
ncbi:hypothetical protein K2173_010740 [Erythroxylum novogranatense]|uniref:Transketolase-like pyrimidine-binding domain-containing protein n=1 Tax=Erythroxylum novogranatense TaxID=1862640 RepID=A0AAV8SRY0_9ROSI|nr:hypothetical protein K2173_010740 [Erythroxylum novogranatense]